MRYDLTKIFHPTGSAFKHSGTPACRYYSAKHEQAGNVPLENGDCGCHPPVTHLPNKDLTALRDFLLIFLLAKIRLLVYKGIVSCFWGRHGGNPRQQKQHFYNQNMLK